MNNIDNNDNLDFRRIWRDIAKAKFLYLISAIFFLAVAVFYCFYRLPQYKTTATILIEDSSGGASGLSGASGVSTIMKTFSMGGFASSSVDNEILILESNKVFASVIESLRLNATYIEKDGISRKLLYKDSPIVVEVADSFYNKLNKGLQLKINLKEGCADIKLCTGFMGTKTIAKLHNSQLPAKIESEFGDIYIMKSPLYRASDERNITVKLSTTASMIIGLRKMIDIDFCDKLADAVSIELKYPNRELGEMIVNTLMNEYNNTRRERRMTTSREESEFLNNRINELLPQLIASEQDMTNFSKENKLAGIEEEAKLIVSSAVKGKTNKVKHEFEINYYNEVLEKLNKSERQLIPIIEGLGNPMIKDYNELVIERNNLATSAKPGNPRITKLDNTLDLMRLSIIDNVNAALDTIRVSGNVVNRLVNDAEKTRNRMPSVQMEYEKLMRDVKFKTELYGFLVQKRENALLNAASTDSMGFIIDPAYTDEKPDMTKLLLVLCACVLLAFICPTMVVFVMFLSRKGWVNELMDINFDNLETNALEYSGHDWQVSLLRNKILEAPSRKLVFVANYGGKADTTALLGELCKSFDNIGKQCTVLEGESEQTFSVSNDLLLSVAFKSRIETEINSGKTVLVSIPNVEKYTIVSPELASETSQLLLVVPVPKCVLRKKLKQLLQPVKDVTRIVTCLYNV